MTGGTNHMPGNVIIDFGRDTSGRPLKMDERTVAKLRAAEKRLRWTFTVVQGSYRAGNGASASAGTHDGGGVIDLRTWDLPAHVTPWNALIALRESGLIAWYRTTAQGFDPHIHAIDHGNPSLAPSAARQVQAWRAGRNGLANNGPDDGPPVTVPTAPPRERETMQFVSRSEWGARDRTARHAIGSTLGVTIHYVGDGMGTFRHDQCAAKVRGIQHFHMDGRGWSDIAYNAVACPHGFVFEGRGVGAMSAANGNTTVNSSWYAVCYLGGKGDGFTEEGKAATIEAVQWLRRNGAGPRVNGHRDHKATACPGDEIYRWLHSTNFDARPTTRDWFDMASADDLRAIVREELDRQSEFFGYRTTVNDPHNPGKGPEHKANLNEVLRAIVGDLARITRKVSRIETKINNATTEPEQPVVDPEPPAPKG